MRYLYFVCELPMVDDADVNHLPPPLPLQSTTARPLLIVPLLPSSTATTTTTVRSIPPVLPLQTTTAPETPSQTDDGSTLRPLLFRSTTISPVTSAAHRFRVRTSSTTVRPSPRESASKTGKSITTTLAPAPNYISVLGFRDLDSNQTIHADDSEALKLAILSDSF